VIKRIFLTIIILSFFTTPVFTQDADQQVACRGLTKKECRENEHCMVMEGPSSCTRDGYCTMDLVYKGCLPKFTKDKTTKPIKSVKTELSECEFITGNGSVDDCIESVAEKKQDVSICSKIETPSIRVSCYKEFAKSKDDLTICDWEENEKFRYECYDFYAQHKQDPAVCRKIPIVELKERCLFYVATNTKNTELCKEIQNPKQREDCYGASDFLESIFTPLSAEEIFKKFIADPIPKSVSNIDGSGQFWQGYSVSLVFTTDEKTFKDLFHDYHPMIKNRKTSFDAGIDSTDELGYCSSDCETEIYYSKNYFEEDLKAIPGLKCFHKKGNVERGEEFTVFWDKNNNKVFFKGRSG
jgi:hypothetical protein